MVFTWFLLVALLTLVRECVADPCLNHKVINEPHRSTAFVANTNDKLLCDRALSPGWYKFQNHNDMPTSCVQSYHCGTHAPVWLKGTLPSVADGIVNRQACVNYGISLFGEKCCNTKLNIRVKNCGTFNVYYLVRTPGCSIAYCAGTSKVCSFGQFNQTTQTCKALYPKLTQLPSLSVPSIDQNNTVTFPCHVDYPTGEKDVAFEIEWTVDNKPLMKPFNGLPVKQILTGDVRDAFLDAFMLQGNLGKTVQCTVRSYYTSTPSIKSAVLKSNGFWAGIRVSKSVVNVDEKGQEVEVFLESTLPIPCNSINKHECKLQVEMQSSNDPNDVSTQSCVYELKYNQATGTFRAPIKLKATRDFLDDHDKVHELSFRSLIDLNQPMWLGYRPPKIQIHTKDQKHGTCLAVADPHYRGIDHKKNYNIYKVGDMVMYKSKTRPFEVQTRTWTCGHYHPCICSVIAREGNDIVEVDMCEKRKNQRAIPEVKVISNGLDATTVDRDPSGKTFYINFASGARITVHAAVAIPRRTKEKDGYLNVNIQAPTDDIAETEGLCGTFDFNPQNDFVGRDGVTHDSNIKTPNSFASSWLLKPGTSMFDQPPPYEDSLRVNHHYCSCSNGTADCTKGKGANNPSRQVCATKCINVASPITHRRNLNAVTYQSEDPDVNLPKEQYYRSVDFVAKNASFPTASGITLVKAKQMCANSLKMSTLYNRCAHEQSMDIAEFIDACVEDVKYSDGDMFMLGHMNAFDSVCQDVVMRNVSNYKLGPNGEMIPPLDVTTHFCPNQCSLKGTCIQGKCNCNNGFTAVDCSVPLNEAPDIDRIRGDGICDVRTQVCSRASVVAENLMDVEHLKCKFRSFTVGEEESVTGSYSVAQGLFKSFLEVDCPLPLLDGGVPAAQGYMISVTTDGHMYSAERMFVVYDSLCQQCDSTDTCVLKNDTCLINGFCRRQGEENNEHQICQPSVNQTQWTSLLGVVEIDHYTATFTGCLCQHDPNSYQCACCKNSGCPCALRQQNQCVECSHMENCGKYPDVFPSTEMEH